MFDDFFLRSLGFVHQIHREFESHAFDITRQHRSDFQHRVHSTSRKNPLSAVRYEEPHVLKSRIGRSNDHARYATLEREGIVPIISNRLSSNTIVQAKSLLEYDNILFLGNGWFQLRDDDSGYFQNCGLHTVVESTASKHAYYCFYEPRAKETKRAILDGNFNLNIEVKCTSGTKKIVEVIVFTVRPGHCVTVIMDFSAARCSLCTRQTANESDVTVLTNAPCCSVRTNIFAHLSIEVRDWNLGVFLNKSTVLSYSLTSVMSTLLPRGLCGTDNSERCCGCQGFRSKVGWWTIEHADFLKKATKKTTPLSQSPAQRLV